MVGDWGRVGNWTGRSDEGERRVGRAMSSSSFMICRHAADMLRWLFC